MEALYAHICINFWIIGGRRIIHGVKTKCITCRRFDAKATCEVTAPLPEGRVRHIRPFYFCGLDYAGPLLTKSRVGVQKIWIALFVCGTTRAVHLEVVDSLATDEFLLAFRRFVARRSMPFQIRLDDATTFRATSVVLSVCWIFNPPCSPWWGGFYERLVGIIRAPLQKVLGNALLSEKELTTVIVEIEGIVNNRPITHVGDFGDELPLTPAKLIGNIWSQESISAHGESEEARPALNLDLSRRRWRYIKSVNEHLESRWKHEYLAQLRGFQWTVSRPIEEEVVVVVDNEKKRQHWQLGLVLQLFEGGDKRSRGLL